MAQLQRMEVKEVVMDRNKWRLVHDAANLLLLGNGEGCLYYSYLQEENLVCNIQVHSKQSLFTPMIESNQEAM